MNEGMRSAISIFGVNQHRPMKKQEIIASNSILRRRAVSMVYIIAPSDLLKYRAKAPVYVQRTYADGLGTQSDIRMQQNMSTLLFIITFGITSCVLPTSPAVPVSDIQRRSTVDFEVSFTATLDYEPSENVKLIGYKTIYLPPEEVEEINVHYQENLDEWIKITNIYYDPHNGSLRVYFPVENALVEHGVDIHEATHTGGLNITIHTDIAVIGREQTEYIRGVSSNIIRDGIIYLADKKYPHHQFENIYVFDFGEKSLDHHYHEGIHERRDEGHTSCMNNHGGPNCSDKFNIHNGRCPARHDVCVDYNGFWTDCHKGGSRWRNFPGSDCFDALSRGHCWNEIM